MVLKQIGRINRPILKGKIMDTIGQTAAERIDAVARELDLTVKAEFVPFSQSRNSKEKHPSLNWRVSLWRGGRVILETDYSAGSGHCPAYRAPVKAMGGANSLMRTGAIAHECETGYAVRAIDSAASPSGYEVRRIAGGKPILPETRDVLASLSMDSSVLDAGGFEEWAGDLGYDTDSRSAEKTYQACLKIALALRSGLGEAGLSKLQAACQDY